MTNFFKLIQALLKDYLSKKLGVAPAAIEEKISAGTHVQYTIQNNGTSDSNNSDLENGVITVTTTVIASEIAIINFVAGDSVRAVQVNSKALGVEKTPINSDKISQALIEKFRLFVEGKLLEEGGFWKQPAKSESRDMHDKTTEKRAEGGFPQAPLAGSGSQDFQDTKTRRRPADMPDFDDELELRPRDHTTRSGGVLGIGEQDLNPPFGARDPVLKPYIDPLAMPPGGGGMYPSADHPMFGRRDGNTSRLGVPPGARFDDPYGEDNLEDMGMGLPGNLRRPGFGGGNGGPSNSSGGSFFGGPSFGGGSFGGGSFGGGSSGGGAFGGSMF